MASLARGRALFVWLAALAGEGGKLPDGVAGKIGLPFAQIALTARGHVITQNCLQQKILQLNLCRYCTVEGLDRNKTSFKTIKDSEDPY